MGTQVDADRVRAEIGGPAPLEPEPFDAIHEQTWREVVPRLRLWNHPRFHAYFSNSSSGPAILAETLTAALNVNAMLWDSSPGAAAVEVTVVEWLADMLGYPRDADGLLVDGASLATLYALSAAREAATYTVRERGLIGGPQLRVYTSDQAHSSVDKAVATLGIGTANCDRLPTSSGRAARSRGIGNAYRTR